MSDKILTETAKTSKNGKLRQIKKFYVYNPITHRHLFKEYNLEKYTEEEADRLGTEWIDKMTKTFKEEKDKITNSANLDVSEFKININDESGISILMVGSTRSGKSTVLNHLMSEYYFPKDNKFINVLFSNSLHSKTYDNFRDKKNVVTSILYQPELIKECYQINSNTKNHYKFNIILDDIVDKKFDKELMRLLTIYRNSCISCIIAAQSLTITNKTSRGNLNHILLFKLNSDEAIESTIKGYLNSYFPSNYKMVDKIKKYKELTEDHHFFHINNLTGEIKRCKLKL